MWWLNSVSLDIYSILYDLHLSHSHSQLIVKICQHLCVCVYYDLQLSLLIVKICQSLVCMHVIYIDDCLEVCFCPVWPWLFLSTAEWLWTSLIGNVCIIGLVVVV